MGSNVIKLKEIRREISDLFVDYQKRRRHIFDEFPTFNIDGHLSAWDQYLAFLDQNKEVEEKARLEHKEKHGRDRSMIIHDGGFGKIIGQIDDSFYDRLNEKYDEVFSGFINSELNNLAEEAFENKS